MTPKYFCRKYYGALKENITNISHTFEHDQSFKFEDHGCMYQGQKNKTNSHIATDPHTCTFPERAKKCVNIWIILYYKKVGNFFWLKSGKFVNLQGKGSNKCENMHG